jgi:predicted lipoprotein with Yx(FWY)xxD motif
MNPTRREVLRSAVLLTASGTIAGCSSGGGDNSTTGDAGAGGDSTTTENGTDATSTVSRTSTSSAASGPAVAVREHPEYGEILVDGDGMTLYLFTRDSRGESVCSGDCADAWPPLTGGNPSAGDGVTASLDTIERDDGSMQVTADGMPLYYYAPDGEPGDATGQGVGDVWFVLRPDGSTVGPDRSTAEPTDTPTSSPTPTGPSVRVSTHPDLGEILTDGDGRTLYLFTRDTAGETPTCTDSCAENWPPLTGGAPQAGDAVTAPLGRIEHPDGSMQVTADGMPLYYFAGDGGPGDASGQGVGDVWYVLRPDGSMVQASATTATPTPSPTPTDVETTATPSPTPTTTDDADGGGDGGYY